MNRMISYEPKDTWIHQLSGVTKLLFFILWCITSAMTYDTRVLLVMIAVTLLVFSLSKTRWQQVSAVFQLVFVFMLLNILAIFILSPYQGCEIYGSRTILFEGIPGHAITAEELFYLFNIIIKYLAITPTVFAFLVTTNPSEFAASLHGVGVPYTIAYSVAIALRYIPDVQDDFRRIRNAQESRGIEMSAKAKLLERIQRTASIIFPLLFATMDRIDVVTNAMELRGFGKKKNRTWYSRKTLGRRDFLVICGTIVFCVLAMVFTFYDGNRFYNPFLA